MSHVKPVSDLQNYSEVLNDVAPGKPVYLTKNGHEQYAIYEAADVKRREAEIRLLFELSRGEKSIQDNGLISAEKVRENLNNASW